MKITDIDDNIKVLIVDDHMVLRRGLRDLLEETPDIVVGGEAGDAAETLNKIRSESWSVVVLDIALPGMDGLELLKQIKVERPQLPVLGLSFFPEDYYGLRMLKAGAAGYLTKNTASNELIDAIRKIASGGRYIQPSLAESLALECDSSHPDRAPHFALSDREFQVLCLFGKGLTVKQISLKLDLSDKTISTYRQRILEKMNISSNMQMIRYVLEHQLTAPENPA